MAAMSHGPHGAQLLFGGGGGGGGGVGGGMGRLGMGGSDRGSEINWAVSRLTGDEARGKVALLTEELKQMKLMNTEIKLVKDALWRQQKELGQLESEGDALQHEVRSEKARRLELARMLEQAKKNNPLLDPEEYPLTDADLEDKPLRATDEDEAAAVAAAEEVDAEMEEAAAAGMMGGAPAGTEPRTTTQQTRAPSSSRVLTRVTCHRRCDHRLLSSFARRSSDGRLALAPYEQHCGRSGARPVVRVVPGASGGVCGGDDASSDSGWRSS